MFLFIKIFPNLFFFSPIIFGTYKNTLFVWSNDLNALVFWDSPFTFVFVETVLAMVY
jgi:hypothetical protein